MATPRVVVVHRHSEYDELLQRHGTRGQVEFVLTSRGRSMAEVDDGHQALIRARTVIEAAIPTAWRRAAVEREDLPRFVFEPRDIVVVVGPDGLVANLAKYLAGQPVIGVNAREDVNVGVLVTHRPSEVGALLPRVAAGEATMLDRTMVEALADDGQRLIALNEIFVGQPGHQSARYRLIMDGVEERQSSSGVIIGTGTGASGWCRSLHRIQAPELKLPAATSADLAWFVREPWPSPATGADLIAGVLAAGETAELVVESEGLVVFGDGIEADRLSLGWGQTVRIRRAPEVLRTVC